MSCESTSTNEELESKYQQQIAQLEQQLSSDLESKYQQQIAQLEQQLSSELENKEGIQTKLDQAWVFIHFTFAITTHSLVGMEVIDLCME